MAKTIKEHAAEMGIEINPGDPVPLTLASKIARERDAEVSRWGRRLGAQIGKQATDGILEGQGVKVPTPKRRGRPPKNPDAAE